MKNILKYKNRIYRKYATDLWGEIIMKGKVTRMFKYLIQVFYIKLKKMYFRKNFSKSRYYKKLFFLRHGRRLYSSLNEFKFNSNKRHLQKKKRSFFSRDKKNVGFTWHSLWN